MDYELKITFDDYKAAQRLAMRPRQAYRITGYLLFALFFIGLTVTLFIAKSDWRILFVIGVVLYLIGFFFLYLPYRWRRLFSQHKLLHEPHQCQFTEDALVSTSDLGNVKIPWGMFSKWKEGRKTFILYQSDNLFHIIPKRIFHGTKEEGFLRNTLLGSVGKPIT
jgi:MFS family permease